MPQADIDTSLIGADPTDEELLIEIRETYDRYLAAWGPIRAEARKDMRTIVEGPWDPAERAARQPEAGPKRPCLTLDELAQYLNQAEGNIRQSKRGVNVEPKGSGTNDKTAELDQGIIRQIEYESNAIESYIGAYVQMLQRSYGACRIRRTYEPGRSMNQILEVAPIQNPDCVLPDPNCKKPDYSDMKRCFVLEPIIKRDFRRRYKNATFKNFTGEQQTEYPKWIGEDNVLLAEYWRLEENKRKLVMYGPEYTVDYLDELPEGSKLYKGTKEAPMLFLPGHGDIQTHKVRDTEDPDVWMYETNGVEILSKTHWTVEIQTLEGKKLKGGREIPILFITGKEVFYSKTDSVDADRYIFSLIRLARDPYMLYCYAATCEAEALGQVPKTSRMGYVGQFEGVEENWASLGKTPLAYVEFHGKTEEMGEQLLPPPALIEWNPPLQEMEIVKEGARRAIQSAIGITGLSNGSPGQDVSARSGIALKTLQAQTSEGNYHFIDAYDAMVRRAGRIMEDNIPVVYETARDQALRKADGTQRMVRINDPNFVDPANPESDPQNFRTDTEPHQVTVSTGPSQQSQRDAVDDFLNTIAGNPQVLQLAMQNPQSTAAKILKMAIKLKDLGPLGDQIADDISPDQPGNIPPQVQQQMAGMAQKLQEATALVGHLTQELKEKTQRKTIEMQWKRAISADKNRTDMVIADIKASAESAQVQLDAEMRKIESMLDFMTQSELAPGPDSAPTPQTDAAGLGLHPQEIPPPPEPAAPEGGAAQ